MLTKKQRTNLIIIEVVSIVVGVFVGILMNAMDFTYGGWNTVLRVAIIAAITFGAPMFYYLRVCPRR